MFGYTHSLPCGLYSCAASRLSAALKLLGSRSRSKSADKQCSCRTKNLLAGMFALDPRVCGQVSPRYPKVRGQAMSVAHHGSRTGMSAPHLHSPERTLVRGRY
jgi:hypothetical protein